MPTDEGLIQDYNLNIQSNNTESSNDGERLRSNTKLYEESYIKKGNNICLTIKTIDKPNPYTGVFLNNIVTFLGGHSWTHSYIKASYKCIS